MPASRGSSIGTAAYSGCMADQDYEHMRIGKLEHLARQGDPRAQEALNGFASELGPLVETAAQAGRRAQADLAKMVTRPASKESLLADIARSNDAKLRREKRAVAAQRETVEKLGEVERLLGMSVNRAEVAEKRERFMVKLTVASTTFGGLAVIAAVVALLA